MSSLLVIKKDMYSNKNNGNQRKISHRKITSETTFRCFNSSSKGMQSSYNTIDCVSTARMSVSRVAEILCYNNINTCTLGADYLGP